MTLENLPKNPACIIVRYPHPPANKPFIVWVYDLDRPRMPEADDPRVRYCAAGADSCHLDIHLATERAREIGPFVGEI